MRHGLRATTCAAIVLSTAGCSKVLGLDFEGYEPVAEGSAASSAGSSAASTGGSCSTGRADCSAETAGCETKLDSDPLHCGQCGHDCFGGECVASACMPKVLAADQLEPDGIAAAAGRMFWVTHGGTVMRFDVESSVVTTLVDRPMGSLILDVATDGQYVYFTDTGLHEIGKVSVDGPGDVTVLAEGLTDPTSIALDGNWVCWTRTNVDGELRRVSKDNLAGGPGEIIITQSEALSLYAANGFVWFTVFGGADGVYTRLIVDGPKTISVAKSQQGPFDVTVLGSTAYFTSQNGGHVSSAPAEGEGEVTEIAKEQDSPRGIAVDADGIFWVNHGDGRIMFAPLDGSEPVRELAVGQDQPQAIATDAGSVYWTNLGDGTVMRLAKPLAPN